MTWLVAHMWIALAGAALVALALGWSIRGMLLLGKIVGSWRRHDNARQLEQRRRLGTQFHRRRCGDIQAHVVTDLRQYFIDQRPLVVRQRLVASNGQKAEFDHDRRNVSMLHFDRSFRAPL